MTSRRLATSASTSPGELVQPPERLMTLAASPVIDPMIGRAPARMPWTLLGMVVRAKGWSLSPRYCTWLVADRCDTSSALSLSTKVTLSTRLVPARSRCSCSRVPDPAMRHLNGSSAAEHKPRQATTGPARRPVCPHRQAPRRHRQLPTHGAPTTTAPISSSPRSGRARGSDPCSHHSAIIAANDGSPRSRSTTPSTSSCSALCEW